MLSLSPRLFAWRPSGLFPICITWPLLWVVISLYLYKSIFKVSFLSLLAFPLCVPPFFPQAVTSSSRAFLLLGRVLHRSRTLGLNFLLCLNEFLTKPLPISPLDFTQSRLDWCTFCSLLSTGAAPPARSLFCILHLPCSCLHFPSNLKGFHYLSLKSIVFIFSISSPKTFKFMFYQHIVCLSLSFFPETLLGG